MLLRYLHDLMYLPLNAPQPPVYGRLRHGQILLQKQRLNLHYRFIFYPQVKDSPFFLREIAFPPEALALGQGKLRLYVQRPTPLTCA